MPPKKTIPITSKKLKESAIKQRELAAEQKELAAEQKELAAEQKETGENVSSKIADETEDEELTYDPERKMFHMSLYMKQFRITDIIVKLTEGRIIVIDADHDEHVDEHGFVSRLFVKHIYVPECVDLDKLISYFTSDGVLVLLAPVKDEKIDTETKIEKKSEDKSKVELQTGSTESNSDFEELEDTGGFDLEIEPDESEEEESQPTI